MDRISVKQLVYDYALKLLFTPYKFGGANPLAGLDCSQLVQELGAVIGLPTPVDMTAQNLHAFYLQHGEVKEPLFGALAFYGASLNEISHIGFCLNESHLIEAGGGDRRTTDSAAAIRQGAYVRIRPIHRRKDLVTIIMPRWPHWE